MAQPPVLTSIQNPASNVLAGLPNAGIAEGSIFVIYGSNMGPSTIAIASAPLPTTFSGTSISITVGGTTVAAPIFYSKATQVAAVLPSTTPVGTGTLSLTYNGATGTFPITVVKSNFGISTVNQTGAGPAVITFSDYSVVSVTHSAKPGDTVVVWGTGLGPITGSDASAPTPTDLGTNITIYIGGKTATVTYRGRSAAPGLDQINFTVPSGVTGCYVPVAIQTGNTVSNFPTIAVSANGGNCTDPLSVPTSSLTNVANGGNIGIGVVSLLQVAINLPAIGGFTLPATITSTGTGNFYRFSGTDLQAAGSLTGAPSVGGCTVSYFTGSNQSFTPTFSSTGLNAGASISVAGPQNLTLNQNTAAKGIYTSSTLQTSLPAGTYTISGTGGSDVGAFMTTLKSPTALVWTNQSTTTTVTKASGLTVNWTGGDPSGFVQIGGYSATTGSNIVGAEFICSAQVSAGTFTVPPAVLLALPNSNSISGVPTGALFVGNTTSPQTFTATGLDYGFAVAGSENIALVNYQ